MFNVFFGQKEPICPSFPKLLPALFQRIHFGGVRWEVDQKQAVSRGLLLEILGDEVRCIVKNDG